MGNSSGNLTKEDNHVACKETARATSDLRNSRDDGTQQNGLYRGTPLPRHQDGRLADSNARDTEMPNAKDALALEILAEPDEKDTMETKQTAEKTDDIKEQGITSLDDAGRALTIKNSRQELQRRDSVAKQKNTGQKKDLITEKKTKMSLRTKQFQKAGRRDTKTVSVSRKQTAENKTMSAKNKGQARSDINNEIDTMASSLKVKDNNLTKDTLVDINHTQTNVNDESSEPDAMHNVDKYVDENRRTVNSITDHVNPYQEIVFSVQQERQSTNRTTSQVRAVDEGKERTAETVNRPYADKKRKSEYREKQKELETSKVEVNTAGVNTAGIAHPRQNIPRNKEAARNLQSETLNARKIKYSRGVQSNPVLAQTSEIIERIENSSSRRNILSRNAKSEIVRQGNLVLPQRKIQSHSAIRAGEKGNGKSKVVKSNDQRTKLFDTKGMSTQTHYKAKPALTVPTKNNTNVKENSIAEKSRKIKSDIYPETSVGTNQRDIQSDTAIRGLRAKQPQKVRMAAIREDEIDERHREASEISITSEEVLIPAEAIINGDEDYDTNSSLRSTALDSRLFGSQSTIVTHTSGVMFPEPFSRFRENKQRLKENLVNLYTFHNFDPPKSLLLPPSYVQIPKFIHPWMTKLKPLSEDIEMQVADEELLDKKKYFTEQCVNTFHDILNYEMNKKAKNIFLVGEPDSGKTEFLRFMIKTWCEQMKKKQADMKDFDLKEAMYSALQTHAVHDDINSGDKPHREQEVVASFSSETSDKGIDNCEATLNIKEQDINSTDKVESENGRKTFDDTIILEEFEYLFYVPLCYNKTRENIHEMIKAQYKAALNNVELDDMVKGSRSRPGENAAFLTELLEKESEKCLIILDGLEEWRPHPGHFRHHENKALVPGKDPTKCYTIITTCTTQKFNTVRQALKTDIDIVIKMRGIDEKEHDNLIEETVKQLNSYYGKNKDPEMFMSQLDSPKFRLLIRSPNLLTSMLFLWYQSGAIGDSLCDMASRLLELHMQKLNLTKELNVVNNTVVVKSDGKSVVLPRYFVKLKYCQINADLLYQLGRMAWTSRKRLGKVFDSTGLDIHGVKFSDVQMCLKAGILSQHQFIGFSPIQHNRTVSFAYSVLQDFLAATYLAMLCRDVTYDNSGNVSEHSNRIQAFVVEHLGFMFSSVETILSFSNLFVMLCGLYPPTIKQITNKVYQAVMDDDRIKEYRRYQNCSEEIPMKVQEFILRCAHESTSVVEDDIHVHIGDLIFQTEPVECLKYLVSSDVKTLDIRVADTERSVTTLTALSDFVYQCRIFDRLIKLEIEDRAVCLTIHDIESLFLLIGRCSQTLNVLSIVLYDNHLGTYTRITQNLDKLLPKLVALQVVELRGMKLGHNRYDALVSAFAEMLQLKQVTLADITCQVAKCEGEEHKFDFSDHENLETIAIDGREIRVSGLNKRAVDRCTLGDLAQGVETQILHSLREAPQMKRFVLKLTALRHRPPFVTKKLIDTFNTWSNIATIILTGINFGENEFSVGKNLAMLAHIGLFEVRMSRNVWCHFVDSLSFMLQKVTLSTRGLTVLPTGQDVTRDLVSRPIDAESRAVILARENETALAMDYVRNNDNVFLMILDIEDIFCFETKK